MCSDSVGLEYSPGTCISDGLPGAALLLVPGPHLGGKASGDFLSDIISERDSADHQTSRGAVLHSHVGTVKEGVHSFFVGFKNWHLHFGRRGGTESVPHPAVEGGGGRRGKSRTNTSRVPSVRQAAAVSPMS